MLVELNEDEVELLVQALEELKEQNDLRPDWSQHWKADQLIVKLEGALGQEGA